MRRIIPAYSLAATLFINCAPETNKDSKTDDSIADKKEASKDDKVPLPTNPKISDHVKDNKEAGK